MTVNLTGSSWTSSVPPSKC